MHSRKVNYWLVAFGLLVTLVGIVDAAGVVRAMPPGIFSRSPQTTALPPEDFGPVDDQARSGFLPVQAPSEKPGGKTALTDQRLLSELEGSTVWSPGDGMSLPTPAPAPPPEVPRLLWIPAINLYAPVIPMQLELVDIDGVEYDQWKAPDEPAVGWHASSATLGISGNTVLNGHHNIYGEVFKDLVELEAGDEIILYSDNFAYRYSVEERVIFPERFAKPEQRVQNAAWIQPTEDERLTLITCWPYESNTHRLVLVAKPVPAGE